MSPSDPDNQRLREALDLSYHGAPAAGKTLRDRFSADEIFQRLTASAAEEIGRDARLLFFSGIAAGTSLGSSFIGRAAMTAAYPDNPLLGNLPYPLGFIMIVIGSYQLFTENTITPVTLVLTRLASVPSLLRLWSIVLLGNLVGAAGIAWILAHTGILEPPVAEAARSFGEHALRVPWSALFWKAVVAGGAVSTMVWLVHAARDTLSRILIIFLITFFIPLANLFHCVTGAFEVLYLVFSGHANLASALLDFFVPVVLGNTVGGVFFVTLVNYAMTDRHRSYHQARQAERLSWTAWLFGKRAD